MPSLIYCDITVTVCMTVFCSGAFSNHQLGKALVGHANQFLLCALLLLNHPLCRNLIRLVVMLFRCFLHFHFRRKENKQNEINGAGRPTRKRFRRPFS